MPGTIHARSVYETIPLHYSNPMSTAEFDPVVLDLVKYLFVRRRYSKANVSIGISKDNALWKPNTHT